MRTTRGLHLATEALGLVTCLALVGCSDDAGSGGADATGDPDAGQDVRLDGFPLQDAGSDAQRDPESDRSEDVQLDEAPDGADAVDVTAVCGRPLVWIRSSGGLTEHGEGRSELLLGEGGYAWYDTQNPDTPIDGLLPDDLSQTVEQALADIGDPDSLEDGYGECCAAWADGADTYIRFAGASDPEREIRVSEYAAAPESLLSLLNLQASIIQHLRDDGAPSLAPALTALPESAEAGCDNHVSHGMVRFHLEGPNGQYVDTTRIEVDGFDGDVYDAPFDLQIDGEIQAMVPGASLTLETPEGALWTLTFDDYPSVLPAVTLSEGHSVTLHIRIAWAFDLNIHGLTISDERGVLFVADEGLTELDDAIDGISVAVVNGCPQVTEEHNCAPSGEQALRFDDSSGSTTAFAGDWIWLTPADGYRLAAVNLKSYSSGYCDDYWNYAWAAVAVAGTDLCEE